VDVIGSLNELKVIAITPCARPTFARWDRSSR
jgi:hypothetical protein